MNNTKLCVSFSRGNQRIKSSGFESMICSDSQAKPQAVEVVCAVNVMFADLRKLKALSNENIAENLSK